MKALRVGSPAPPGCAIGGKTQTNTPRSHAVRSFVSSLRSCLPPKAAPNPERSISAPLGLCVDPSCIPSWTFMPFMVKTALLHFDDLRHRRRANLVGGLRAEER